MQTISPFLWFDGNAEEAMNFYTSIFKNAKIENVIRYGEVGPGPKGTVMSCTFQLNGQQFMAINGGPHFTFSDEDAEKSGRVMKAMLQMDKIDIEKLKQAYEAI